MKIFPTLKEPLTGAWMSPRLARLVEQRLILTTDPSEDLFALQVYDDCGLFRFRLLYFCIMERSTNLVPTILEYSWSLPPGRLFWKYRTTTETCSE
jgi:hypothetical protein